MACYLTKDNILFSNDAFGQHYATEKLFNDLVDQCELFNECIKYYANILTPFSAILRRNWPRSSLLAFRSYHCDEPRVIWRDKPMQIVTMPNGPTIIENQIQSSTTRCGTVQRNLQRGSQGERQTRMLPSNVQLAKNDDNDVIMEVFEVKTVVVGSPTVVEIASFIQLQDSCTR